MSEPRDRIEIVSFTTEEELCPYLHDRPSRQRISVVGQLSPSEYGRLLAAGWRRFGSVLFQPGCDDCSECVPIRVLVKRFEPSKSQRRVLRRNRDLRLEIGEPRVDEERLQLYHRFHEERARSRGWTLRDLSALEYAETFVENASSTLEFRYFLEKRLVGVAYVGDARDSLNSIYAFSDPAHARRSLGTFDVLEELAEARRRGKDHLYLGFLVKDCLSMSYKASFRPHELLKNRTWTADS
ncbi:MAG: arginyltransferase [Planctomycetota bacterium]|nr:arginyltransferase [Planctomycetota bacterium]